MIRYEHWATILLWAAASALVGGCDSATEVTVAQTPAELDLRRCFGAGTVCGPSDVRKTELNNPDIRSCEGSGPRTVTLAWQIELAGREYIPAPRALFTDQFAVSGNGSIWVAGPAEHGAFVAHYNPVGQLLGSAAVALDQQVPGYKGLSGLMLAVDSSGRAYVGYTTELVDVGLEWPYQEGLWLGRYAANAEVIGELIQIHALGPPLLIGIGGDDTLLVAARGQEDATAMSRFEIDGSLRWTQTGVRQGYTWGLVGDAWGRTALMGHESEPVPGDPGVSIAMYNERGNLLWDRVSLLHTEGPIRLVSGPADDLIMVGTVLFALAGGGAVMSDAVVHRIDTEGRVLWARRLVGTNGLSIPLADGINLSPVIDAAGNVYFTPGDRSIYVVSADGVQCDRLELEAPSSRIVDIGVSADGALSVALWAPDPVADSWSIARVRL